MISSAFPSLWPDADSASELSSDPLEFAGSALDRCFCPRSCTQIKDHFGILDFESGSKYHTVCPDCFGGLGKHLKTLETNLKMSA
jgi:hypothetical protein